MNNEWDCKHCDGIGCKSCRKDAPIVAEIVTVPEIEGDFDNDDWCHDADMESR